MTIPTRLDSNQLARLGFSREQADVLARAEGIQALLQSQNVVAGRIVDGEVIRQKTSSGQFNRYNLWPNPTSEISPPSSYTPPGDGTEPEFDFRFNAGAGAYAGSWVRRIVRSSAGTSVLEAKVPAKEGEFYAMSLQQKLISNSAFCFVRIAFYDSTGAQISSTANGMGTLGSWALASVTSVSAPAGTVTVGFRIELQWISGTPELWVDSIEVKRLIRTEDVAAISGSVLDAGSIDTTRLGNGAVTPAKVGGPLNGAGSNWNISPAITVNAASSWVDVPGTSLSFAPKNGYSAIHVILMLTGFIDTAVNFAISLRFMANVGGAGFAQQGPTYTMFYNVAGQHLSWAFQFTLAAGALGIVTASTPVKWQVLVNSATGRFLMDVNDSASHVVADLG